ncbi:enoyl-CoA hydratase/isomerase family protein [Nonomuraea sp. FMUSA5-5]|uniref:Enoyl-CoA hydratase/isomerase family protein n=1 Tax=Nonomuraea composti TaxID=2720023 RepID=A0ABX1AU77_9ACTN|nr:enoyl-CoA hydratase/isomerase family protein [Nonomuraea sp. FMUSA5-5]NJP88451.1 enoyl-CoA hydratase/isomerase family protein [Nonomuraea sp. FMUSA5-5]
MIETADHAGIAVLTLAHGPVNALDLELLTAVPEVLATVAGARAVVLTGRGRAFSAGVDLKRIVEGGPEYVERFLPALSAAALALFEHPRPVVAAVNGHALAGGCVLAAACDARLMSGGTIGLTELAAGVPFPTVPLEIMRHAAGPALEAMVLGAGRLDPGRAVAIGLVHEVVEPDRLLAEALRRAEALCAAPPDVYAFAKRQLRAPALERVRAARDRDDPEVLAMWSSERTHTILRDYLAGLSKNRSQ